MESIVQTCVAQRRRVTALPKHQSEVQLLSVVISHCIRDLELYLLLLNAKNKQVHARANATITLKLSASVTLVDKTETVSKPGTHGPKCPPPQKLVRSSL